MSEPPTDDAELFRLLVASVADYAIFMLDPTGRVVTWNAGAARLKGYTASEAVGQHFSLFYTDADRARAHPEEELALATKSGSFSEEGWRVRKDGTQFWASVVITPMRDVNGGLVGFAKVTRDITERRNAEEALRHSNEELEARVRDRTRELEASNRDLAAFNYSVSHDLRAPLRALDGFSNMLAERVGEGLDAEARDYLARLQAAARRMTTLIDAMQALSRLTRVPVRRAPLDITALAAEIVRELQQSHPDRTVNVRIADGLCAHADPSLLRSALENLLRNAWKYTGKRDDASVEVSAENHNGERVFLVRDNGAGFDMTQAHRLFVPFQRLHRAKDFEGTGIGLATVSRIVERHGGRIWATASPGQGATFLFTLGDQTA